MALLDISHNHPLALIQHFCHCENPDSHAKRKEQTGEYARRKQ
jgi:hypothetical protein